MHSAATSIHSPDAVRLPRDNKTVPAYTVFGKHVMQISGDSAWLTVVMV
jgi:hypothetical protein